MIPWNLGDGGHGARVGRENESRDRRECSLANTRQNSRKYFVCQHNVLDIIRIEREGVEKAGVEALMRGVRGMGPGRDRGNCKMRARRKRLEEKSKAPRAKPAYRAAAALQLL